MSRLRALAPSRLALTAAFVALLTVGLGCHGTTSPEPDPAKTYLAPTSPENVLHNLAAAFDNESLSQVDTLLADSFQLQFNDDDLPGSPPDSLSRTQFVVGLTSLFGTSSSVGLTYTLNSLGDDNRIGHAGWKKALLGAALTVTYQNGNNLTVNDAMQLSFIQVPPGSSTWKIREWTGLLPVGHSFDRPTRATTIAPGRHRQ